jgi:hypothetical protein
MQGFEAHTSQESARLNSHMVAGEQVPFQVRFILFWRQCFSSFFSGLIFCVLFVCCLLLFSKEILGSKEHNRIKHRHFLFD